MKYQVKEGVDGWSRDENGELIRRVGNNIEHVPQFIGVGAHSETEKEEPTIIDDKECPFRHGVNAKCRRDCPLFHEKACALKVPGADAKGGNCPFRTMVCGSKCAVYAGGCGVAAIAKRMKERIENE